MLKSATQNDSFGFTYYTITSNLTKEIQNNIILIIVNAIKYN